MVILLIKLINNHDILIKTMVISNKHSSNNTSNNAMVYSTNTNTNTYTDTENTNRNSI